MRKVGQDVSICDKSCHCCHKSPPRADLMMLMHRCGSSFHGRERNQRSLGSLSTTRWSSPVLPHEGISVGSMPQLLDGNPGSIGAMLPLVDIGPMAVFWGM